MDKILGVSGFVLLLAGYSYLITHIIPKRFYTMSNLLASVLALAYAVFFGLDLNNLGLSQSNFVGGLLFGILFSLPIVIGLPALVFNSRTRGYFTAKPSGFKNLRKALAELGIRVPFGTALSEEILFRGVLLGLLVYHFNSPVALIISSVIFGLWHVLPTLKDFEEIDPMTSAVESKLPRRSYAVLITFVATTLIGLLFGWLRLVSGSLVAPWIVHATINLLALGGGYLAIWYQKRS